MQRRARGEGRPAGLEGQRQHDLGADGVGQRVDDVALQRREVVEPVQEDRRRAPAARVLAQRVERGGDVLWTVAAAGALLGATVGEDERAELLGEAGARRLAGRPVAQRAVTSAAARCAPPPAPGRTRRARARSQASARRRPGAPAAWRRSRRRRPARAAARSACGRRRRRGRPARAAGRRSARRGRRGRRRPGPARGGRSRRRPSSARPAAARRPRGRARPPGRCGPWPRSRDR